MTRSEYNERLKLAQEIAPETTGIMVDADGDWFGHRDYHPTTGLLSLQREDDRRITTVENHGAVSALT
jgi:hypothetical protein